jgi:Protein of unknown function (DUF1236)
MAVITALLASPLAALAQGVPQGAQRGAEEGSALGGPVGGAIGGVAGRIGGLLSVGQAPRFHNYVIREHRSVYIPGVIPEAGMILPPGGIIYYAVPPEFRVALRYRYAIVNDHVVLINPGTREVVQVIK